MNPFKANPKARSTVKSSPVTNMSRGFSSLSILDIARQEYVKLTEARNRKNPPKTFEEIYERLPFLEGYDEVLYPYHLQPVIDELYLACDKEVRFVLHTPARHGKSQLIRTAFTWYHYNKPGLIHCYVTYNQRRAFAAMKSYIEELQHMGIEYKAWNNDLLIGGGPKKGGTKIMFTSVGSSITGEDLSGVAFIDDPLDGSEVFSPRVREKLWDWLGRNIFSRKMKRLSVVNVMTRHHPDDLSGRLIDKLDWPYLRLPMICDSNDDLLGRDIGEPLWPEVFDIEQCRQMQDDYGTKRWASMAQGQPRSDSDQVFETPVTYDELPKGARLKWSIGMDCAGYGKTKTPGQDWSVAVKLAQDQDTGWVYVVDVTRQQCRFEKFIPTLVRFIEGTPPCSIKWWVNTTESALASVISSQDYKAFPYKIDVATTNIDKMSRAWNGQTIQTWNAGRILIPSRRDRYMNEFVKQVELFTGIGDLHDDDVDALVAAFDGLNTIKKSWGKILTPGQQNNPFKSDQYSAASRLRSDELSQLNVANSRWGKVL